jgi:membrane protein required for colicin V production
VSALRTWIIYTSKKTLRKLPFAPNGSSRYSRSCFRNFVRNFFEQGILAMQAYDLIMLIVLAATTIFGAIKGFAWQLASLASIVVSYFIAYSFRNDVSKMINAQPPWNLFLAMLLLYFGSSLIIWMLFRLVSTSIDKIRLKEFDRHLGAGFGLLKGMVLCLIITMFSMTLLGASQQQRIANSKSGLYISRILANADGILPVEIKQIVGPYISDVGNRLQQNQSGMVVPAGDGPLEGLGRMIQERVSQFGNDALNGQQQQQPGGFLTGQAGSPQNQGGGFFGPGQGAPTNAQLSWPAPPAQPQPGSGWPSGFQSGSGGNDVLPR